ncbi:MAG: aconitase family protein [Acidobacteriota bacterium]
MSVEPATLIGSSHHLQNTIANMMAGEAQNGIFAPDEITYALVPRAEGIADLPYPAIAPGADARYERDETVPLTDLVPMIAKPHSPGNAFAAAEVARERVTFDKALIGSCTNGSYDDLLQAALVIHAARQLGTRSVAKELVVFPGSGGVKKRIEDPDPRPGGESIAHVFRSVGGQIRESWCGPRFGQGPDALKRGQRAITTFNRNWQNRMGSAARVISRAPRRGRSVGTARLHGAAERARPRRGRPTGSASEDLVWSRTSRRALLLLCERARGDRGSRPRPVWPLRHQRRSLLRGCTDHRGEPQDDPGDSGSCSRIV